MRVAAGTSGFSYPAWRGPFYPPGLPPARMLGWYAARLPAVEANATFYRLPRPELLAAWRAQVPPGFLFALKAPRGLTHVKRLRGGEGLLAALLRAAAELGPALGPILFQLPPALRRDLPLLEDFLALLPGGGRAAFEFRHRSWLDDAVLATLAAHRAALCVVDADEGATPLVATAGFGYLRLRRATYDGSDLLGWVDRVRAQPWAEALVFFKHEDEARGPAYALAFQRLAAEAAGASPRA